MASARWADSWSAIASCARADTSETIRRIAAAFIVRSLPAPRPVRLLGYFRS